MYRKNNMGHQRGFTLIELLIVIAIMGTLLAIATFQFSQYLRKTAMENQTKTLYLDMLNLRNRALYEKRNKAIVIGSTSYSLYSTDTTTAAPVSVHTLRYSIQWDGDSRIVFGTNGLIQDAPVDGWAICITGDNPAAVDGVRLTMASIQSGKRKGAFCNASTVKAY